MTFRILAKFLRYAVAVLLVGDVSPLLFAQGPIPDAPTPSVEATSAIVTPTPTPRAGSEHRFWDMQNIALFSTSAALGWADFGVTRSNLQSGGKELNPVVRVFGHSSSGLSLNFACETAGTVGLSYLFHKTGHHKLERAVSIVNIGASAGAVSYGLAHR
jgi:hypothetical protein